MLNRSGVSWMARERWRAVAGGLVEGNAVILVSSRKRVRGWPLLKVAPFRGCQRPCAPRLQISRDHRPHPLSFTAFYSNLRQLDPFHSAAASEAGPD
jgi:hypothetical protein